MNVKMSLKKYSPEILTGLGIGGFTTAAVLSAKATPKAYGLLLDEEDAKGEELTFLEKAKAVWKCYIPAAALCVSSAGIIIYGNRIHAKRGAAIAAAYKLSELAYTEYKDAALTALGEKKERNMRGKYIENRIADYPVVTDSTDGRPLCLDWPSKRYFRATRDEVIDAVNHINAELSSGEGYASMNDLHNLFGLEDSENGAILGWSISTGLLEVDTSESVTAPNGEPCMIVNYQVYPGHNFDLYYN